ncbi:glyoxylate reductase [Aerococcus agrisoli]|uniref:Glyoxylate reductase n=1 Tax=Aerococcus agrisoli TaxID=2487350 RepID=A0A3N4GI05_9LACT|nr:NAD(P)-dependent oxidoreductase [Aerococcus agrisoli]RPA62412.1 glyoxylate reductase [Aerococcus agrisoli]
MSKLLAIATTIKDWQVAEISALAEEYTVRLASDLTDEDFPNIEILYGWKNEFADQFLTQGYDSLRWIQVQFAGVNQLPSEILSDDNIRITNMSGIHAIPITETVFGYILNQYRHLLLYKTRQASSTWQAEANHRSLTDKKIIVFGAGNIGREIARLAKAFGMVTIGVNTSGRAVEYFDTTVDTDTALAESTDADIIVNVLPATDATNNIFSLDFFSRQTAQPIFINVGRGNAVVDEDLIAALDQEFLSYAALDVFDVEPLASDHPFWQHEKIDVTPHMTGQVEHFADETYKIFHANITDYLAKNELPVNLVSKEKGY